MGRGGQDKLRVRIGGRHVKGCTNHACTLFCVMKFSVYIIRDGALGRFVAEWPEKAVHFLSKFLLYIFV